MVISTFEIHDLLFVLVLTSCDLPLTFLIFSSRTFLSGHPYSSLEPMLYAFHEEKHSLCKLVLGLKLVISESTYWTATIDF